MWNSDLLQIRLAQYSQVFDVGLAFIAAGLVIVGLAATIPPTTLNVVNGYYANCSAATLTLTSNRANILSAMLVLNSNNTSTSERVIASHIMNDSIQSAAFMGNVERSCNGTTLASYVSQEDKGFTTIVNWGYLSITLGALLAFFAALSTYDLKRNINKRKKHSRRR